MSTQPPVQLRQLLPEDDLLRALLNSRQARDLHEAFLLRHDEKDSGLSVKYDCTPEECRSEFNKTYGVASLTVRCVRDLELDVVPDQLTHANIIGIPYKEDNPDRAEWFASKLAECAQIVDRGIWKRP
jgi:hypothetical protein